MKKEKKDSFHITQLVSLFIFVLFSFLFCFTSSLTFEYDLDRFAFKINDFYKSNIIDADFVPKIVSISNNNTSDVYLDLFKTFYYNELNGQTRCMVTNNTNFEGINVQLITQPTFSIRKEKEKEGAYYLDYGLYYTYFCNEYFPEREYLSIRNGCDSFVMISDVLADYLVDFYGINTENPYKTLLLDPSYCVLNLNVDGVNTIKLSINNIVRSDLRQGPRTTQLFEYFGVVYLSGKAKTLLNTCFDIELKDNAYGIKKTISSIDALGYSFKTNSLEIKSLNLLTGAYETDNELTTIYKNIYENKENKLSPFFSFVVLFIGFIFLFIDYLFVKRKGFSIFSVITVLILSLIFMIIITFTYSYHLFSIPFIVYTFLIVFLYWKEVKNEIKRHVRKPVKTNVDKHLTYIKIEI